VLPPKGPRPLPAPHRHGAPPIWLRGLLLFVVLWLAVRIIDNVTDSLSGIAGLHKPASTIVSGRG
jgi:hypothetical protein